MNLFLIRREKQLKFEPQIFVSVFEFHKTKRIIIVCLILGLVLCSMYKQNHIILCLCNTFILGFQVQLSLLGKT